VSCLPALRALAARAPIAIIGAGRGGDCAPKPSNYAAFARACGGSAGGGSTAGQGPGCALVVATDAGHLQFVERRTALQQSVCFASSKVDESALRAWTAAVIASHGFNAAGGAGEGGPCGAASSIEATQAWRDLGTKLGLQVLA
jgi:hypothetical protein